MHDNRTYLPASRWTQDEETALLLARELEWAEAYAADYPHCQMGRIYLDFLRHELRQLFEF